MTINVARHYGEQESEGSLEVGKLADLVILDRNPLKVDPMQIKDLEVVETIKEGQDDLQEGRLALRIKAGFRTGDGR